ELATVRVLAVPGDVVRTRLEHSVRERANLTTRHVEETELDARARRHLERDDRGAVDRMRTGAVERELRSVRRTDARHVGGGAGSEDGEVVDTGLDERTGTQVAGDELELHVAEIAQQCIQVRLDLDPVILIALIPLDVDP